MSKADHSLVDTCRVAVTTIAEETSFLEGTLGCSSFTSRYVEHMATSALW